MANEKQLPCNVEAEAGVLGSLLIDPDAIVVIASLLQPDDFYIEAHRTIYQSVRALYEAGGAADLITICDDLERRGSLKEIGGASFVGSLANQVPTSRNAVHYAKIVEDHATRRRLIEAAGKIAGGAYHGTDADAALEQAERLVHDVARRRPERDNGSWAATMDEVLAELLDGVEGAGLTLGMPSCFERLDRHMVGLRRKELAYVMARPGVGKTMFGGHVAYYNAVKLAEMGEGCVEWFTMEMSSAPFLKTGIDCAGRWGEEVPDAQIACSSPARRCRGRTPGAPLGPESACPRRLGGACPHDRPQLGWGAHPDHR